MTARELEEYRALRETIRERGTTRVWVFVIGLIAWASLVLVAAALVPLPIAALVPLLVLAATFEAVVSLHTGVERIGRYIQVFFEDEPSDKGWEHRVMKLAGGPDPLFTLHFSAAALFNLIPLVLAGAVAIEWAVVGSIHLLFVARVIAAGRRATRQRASDLQQFRDLNKS